ncbi:anaphase-promoting complex subunit CDC26 isoform 1-T1 [Acanthopagrus schlegelii]
MFFRWTERQQTNTRGEKSRENPATIHLSEKMLRRKPTRLELKIDDTEEFESVKKELEARKRQREEAESGGGMGGASVISVDIIGGGASASASSSTAASRAELINERIGYKPHPKPATLPTLFGSLQF